MLFNVLQKVDPKDDRTLEFDGYIDLGRELSILHTVLVESLANLTDATNSKLRGLMDILQRITDALNQPSPSLSSHSGVSGHLNGSQVDFGLGGQDSNANGVAVVSNLLKEYDSSSLASSTMNTSYSSSVRTVRGFDNPHRNGSISSMVSSSAQEMVTAHEVTVSSSSSHQQPHATDDYILYTSVEPSLPDHLQDDRLGPSQSTPSMKRPDEKIINQSWDKIVSAAEMVNGGEYVDLITFMDQSSHEGNSSAEMDFQTGDQMSVGQLSNVASSGYQSFAGGYSQSSSPIDSETQTTSQTQPLSFANPLFGHLNAGSSLNRSKASPRQRSPSTSSLSDTDSLRQQFTRQKPPVRNMSSSSNSSSESLPRSQLANSSPHIPRSSPPMSKTGLRVSELSRSVELRPPAAPMNGSPSGMKRTVTDTGISTSCSTSHDPVGYGSLRGQGSKGNPVRMGVRSVQRKLKEQEKSKVEVRKGAIKL